MAQVSYLFWVRHGQYVGYDKNRRLKEVVLTVCSFKRVEVHRLYIVDQRGHLHAGLCFLPSRALRWKKRTP